MSNTSVVESGLQLMTRLIDRPSVEDLDEKLFFKKLNNTDVIELRGTFSSGTTLLLIKLIVKCILPFQCNGINMDVLLINTENQFQVSHLVDTLKSEISNNQETANVDSVVKDSLHNLKIINCYNYPQFLVTIKSLSNMLLDSKKVGLLVIDSIDAYSWQQTKPYKTYIMKILDIITTVAKDFKVVTLYTKQFKFESKKQNLSWKEERKFLRYAITLYRNEDNNKLSCEIQSGKYKKQLYYEICENRIVWKEETNKKIIVS